MATGRRTGGGARTEEQAIDPDAWIPEEFSFLKKRSGPPASREVLALLQQQFRKDLESAEANSGKYDHDLGTLLVRMYDGQAERVYGGGSFTAWASATFELGRQDVYRYLRIAAAFTEEQCRSIGKTVLDLGVDIMELKGWKTADPLFTTQFDIGLEEKVGYPNKREVVRLIVASLRKKPTEAGEEDESFADRVARMNRRWRVKQAENEVLASIKGRYQRKGDEIVFNAGPMTALQRREYAHFVLEVEQPGRRR